MMEFKKVSIEDIDDVMIIIYDAIALLGKDSLQWQQGYPNRNTMMEDIHNGDLFGVYENDKLVGVVALVKGININYTEIYDGKWMTPSKETDLVIHRIAVKSTHHGRHIGQLMMKCAEKYAKENGCDSIKVDTHIKNKPMQHLCLSNGYQYCGIIYLKRAEEDNSRLAYEKNI